MDHLYNFEKLKKSYYLITGCTGKVQRSAAKFPGLSFIHLLFIFLLKVYYNSVSVQCT